MGMFRQFLWRYLHDMSSHEYFATINGDMGPPCTRKKKIPLKNSYKTDLFRELVSKTNPFGSFCHILILQGGMWCINYLQFIQKVLNNQLANHNFCESLYRSHWIYRDILNLDLPIWSTALRRHLKPTQGARISYLQPLTDALFIKHVQTRHATPTRKSSRQIAHLLHPQRVVTLSRPAPTHDLHPPLLLD